MQLGYLPDPISTKDLNGNARVGSHVDTVRGSQYTERDFEDLKVGFTAIHQGDVDLSPHCRETNQFQLQACAGNATTVALEMINSIEGKPHVDLSRLFTYSMSRMLQDDDQNGQNDLDKDAGTYIRLCFDVLSRFGVCRETTWPYETDKVFTSPSLLAQQEATGHHVKGYYRIRTDGQDRINDILTALRANHPIVFGTKIDQAFTQLANEGPVDKPKGSTIGGHAMIIVGYISGKGFLIKNSWSKKWGSGGFCFMTPEYLMWEDTNDLWVPTIGTVFTK